MKKLFRCKCCGEEVEVSLWKRICVPHLFGKKLYMKCSSCGKRNWHKRVNKKDSVKNINNDRVKVIN